MKASKAISLFLCLLMISGDLSASVGESTLASQQDQAIVKKTSHAKVQELEKEQPKKRLLVDEEGVGLRVQALIENSGLTLDELKKRLRYTKKSKVLEKFMEGNFSGVRLNQLILFVDFFHISLEELFFGVKTPDNHLPYGEVLSVLYFRTNFKAGWEEYLEKENISEEKRSRLSDFAQKTGLLGQRLAELLEGVMMPSLVEFINIALFYEGNFNRLVRGDVYALRERQEEVEEEVLKMLEALTVSRNIKKTERNLAVAWYIPGILSRRPTYASRFSWNTPKQTVSMRNSLHKKLTGLGLLRQGTILPLLNSESLWIDKLEFQQLDNRKMRERAYQGLDAPTSKFLENIDESYAREFPEVELDGDLLDQQARLKLEEANWETLGIKKNPQQSFVDRHWIIRNKEPEENDESLLQSALSPWVDEEQAKGESESEELTRLTAESEELREEIMEVFHTVVEILEGNEAQEEDEDSTLNQLRRYYKSFQEGPHSIIRYPASNVDGTKRHKARVQLVDETIRKMMKSNDGIIRETLDQITRKLYEIRRLETRSLHIKEGLPPNALSLIRDGEVPLSQFMRWVNSILKSDDIQANNRILSDEEMRAFAQKLGVSHRAEKEMQRGKGRAFYAYQFYLGKIKEQGGTNVYLMRDGLSLYAAELLSGGDPKMFYLSKKTFRHFLETQQNIANTLIFRIIAAVRDQLGFSRYGLIPKENFPVFKERFFEQVRLEIMGEGDKLIFSEKERDALRDAANKIGAYLDLQITSDLQDGMIRFVDSSKTGSFPLFLEALVYIWSDGKVASDSQLFYSQLSKAINFAPPEFKSGFVVEFEDYPFQFSGRMNEFNEPLVTLTGGIGQMQLFRFQLEVLRNELLKNIKESERVQQLSEQVLFSIDPESIRHVDILAILNELGDHIENLSIEDITPDLVEDLMKLRHSLEGGEESLTAVGRYKIDVIEYYLFRLIRQGKISESELAEITEELESLYESIETDMQKQILLSA